MLHARGNRGAGRGATGAAIVRMILLNLWLLMPLPVCGADGIKEAEVTSDPPAGGQQTVTIRLRPSRSHICDRITFDCTLRQEFPWETGWQQKTNRVHEPATFPHRRKEVKLVEDLDCYISFRVPVAMDRLVDIYGTATFNTNYPVTVSRVRITGTVKDETVWSIEAAANAGPVRVGAAPPAEKSKPADSAR